MINAEFKVILSQKKLQGHCTNSNVTYLQPQQQLQLVQLFGHCEIRHKQQYFHASLECNVQFRVSGRR